MIEVGSCRPFIIITIKIIIMIIVLYLFIFRDFWKGRELSMGSSVMYALTLTIVGLAILLSENLSSNVDENTSHVSNYLLYVLMC